MILRDVPVDPDALLARQWLLDELTDPVYHEPPNVLDLLIGWLLGLFAGASVLGLDGPWAALVIVVVVLTLALVALRVAGPLRRTAALRRGPAVLDDDARTADRISAAASVLAQQGDVRAATLEVFRAIVRRSEERVLLDERPGRTAHEAAAALGTLLPGTAEPLAHAASTFDALYYGRLDARPRDYEQMRHVEQLVLSARRPATDRVAADPATVAPR